MRHGMICNIEQLKIGHSTPDDEVNTARENYAKAALMLFYPFRGKGDLTIHGSYWCKFESVADCHCQGPSAPLTTDTTSAQPTFWSYGKTILQNIQTRMTVENNKLRTPDLLQMMTITPEDVDRPRRSTDDHKTDGINIEEFDVEDDIANDTENMEYNTLRTHDILMGRSTNIPQSNLPAAHTTSNSLFISSRSVGEATDDTEPNINGETDLIAESCTMPSMNTHFDILTFIGGSLIGKLSTSTFVRSLCM